VAHLKHRVTCVPTEWYVNPLNGVSRAHDCDRRQTDHATEKCLPNCRNRLQRQRFCLKVK